MLIAEYYNWIKALHVIAVISWMAGMFYLPRLFVYHVHATKEQADLLTIMERKLLRIIINPAMVVTFITGAVIAVFYIKNDKTGLLGWLAVKGVAVFALAGLHGFLSSSRRKFANGKNTRSEKFWRIMNEVPVLLMILIVIMVIVKPF